MKLIIEDNTVPVLEQVNETDTLKLYEAEGATKKIAIVGNSITLHNPKPSIGWYGEWGMAASSAEKDFCHLIMHDIRKKHPQTSFMIVQAAQWEWDFWAEPKDYPKQLKAIDIFDPDIVIFRIGENVNKEKCAEHDFNKGFMTLCDHISNGGKRKLLITETFWVSPWTTKGLLDAANKHSDGIIPLSDLGNRDEMMALGLYPEHGVCIHPGDLGMRTIADRILEKLYKII